MYAGSSNRVSRQNSKTEPSFAAKHSTAEIFPLGHSGAPSPSETKVEELNKDKLINVLHIKTFHNIMVKP